MKIQKNTGKIMRCHFAHYLIFALGLYIALHDRAIIISSLFGTYIGLFDDAKMFSTN